MQEVPKHFRGNTDTHARFPAIARVDARPALQVTVFRGLRACYKQTMRLTWALPAVAVPAGATDSRLANTVIQPLHP